MRKLATIEKVIKIEPIEGKDRIVYATILGWHVIVDKSIKENDLVVYVEYDSILPEIPEFEFLRKRCYSEKYNGFRIKNMKMAGVFSEGIVFKIEDIKALKNVKIKEGLEVAKKIGIRKYDIEEISEKVVYKNPVKKYFMRYKWVRKLFKKPKYGYPMYIHKANETNIQVKFRNVKGKGYTFYVTEKLEGQAACYHVKKKSFKVYSHRVGLKKSDNNWWKIALKFDIENKIKLYMKKHKIKEMYIMGEIIGPGIQKNIYQLNDLDFYIFTIENLDTRTKFDLNYMKKFSEETGLKLVPLLKEGIKLPGDSDFILKDAEGKSVLNSKLKGEREGVIYRTMDGENGFKAKSKKYQLLFGN